MLRLQQANRRTVEFGTTASPSPASLAAMQAASQPSAGIPLELLTQPKSGPANVARALQLWDRARPASGTLAEAYLQGRGITEPVPRSIRFLERQKNWSDGGFYPATVSLVERVPSDDDPPDPPLIRSGIHLTFVAGPDANGIVRKAATEQNKLTLGQLRHGALSVETA